MFFNYLFNFLLLMVEPMEMTCSYYDNKVGCIKKDLYDGEFYFAFVQPWRMKRFNLCVNLKNRELKKG